MTDIVERLRDCHLVFKHKDIAEAAAEIERLRTDRQKLSELFYDHYWDSLQKDRDLILQHIHAVLRMVPEYTG